MRYRTAVVGVIALSCLPGERTEALGQVEVTKYFVGPISGTVVAADGQPVADASVWLIGGKRDEDPVVLHETTTDSQGTFEIAQREEEFVPRLTRSPGIVVRDAQGRAGGTSYISLRSSPRSDPYEVRIQLHQLKDYRGQLVDASGKPIVKARIKPTRWSGGAVGESTREGFQLSADMIEKSTGETDGAGRFVLRQLPGQGTISVTIIADQFASPYANFTLEKPVTIKLGHPGSIQGTVKGEGQPDGLAEVALFLSLAHEVARARGGDFRVYYYTEGSSLADGTFRFDRITPGKYIIRPQLDKDSPFVTAPTSTIDLKSGQTADVTLLLKRAIAVHGKVVDKKTGAGVKDAQVYFRDTVPGGATTWGKTATTDTEGKYTVYAKPGKLVADIMRVPEGYIRPRRDGDEARIEVSAEMQWPTIQLEPTAELNGTVVDETGKPVAGADITAMTEDSYFDRDQAKSDEAGNFVLRKGTPKTPLTIRVRTGTAVSDGPVVVVPAEADGPVHIVVSEKKAFAMQGVLLDVAGQPIRSAQVHLHTQWRTAGGAIGFRLSTGTTDDQGGFQFPALWPGDRYHIQVEAAGYEKYQSPRIQAVAGRTHDFATINLISAKGVVEGRVVDSAGQPLEGVQVFNAGDAPEPLASASGADGSFRLRGFRPGRVHVFAKRPDFRFTGVSVETGATDTSIMLLRKDEPPPPFVRPDYPSLDEQREIARTILERLWQVEDREKVARAAMAMARLDVELAMEWSSQIGGKYGRSIREIAAEQIAESDLDEALTLLAANGSTAYHSFKNLAEKLATSDPARALRCVEETTALARAMDQPGRAICLADAGNLVMRLGNEETGRQLVEEAAEMVRQMRSGESTTRACGTVAKALASFDPAGAEKLLESITDANERKRYVVGVAVAVAAHDLAKAQDMLKGVESWYIERAAVPIAYHVAQSQPDEALKFLDSAVAGQPGRESGREVKTRAQALGWVAMAIAERDRTRSWSLIDQGLDLCAGPHEGRSEWGIYGGRPIQAALIAVRAAEVGHPDMESVVHRVLASRMTSSESHSPIATVEANVAMAMILALVDPHTAREILHTMEAQSKAIGSGGSGIGRRVWLQAWAVADPQQVPERVEHELATNRDDPDWDISRSDIWEMIEILTIPPTERLPRLTRNLGGIWTPGERL